MTRTEYISAGYPISSVVEQAVIDRAENDVKQAYILPIIEEPDYTNETVKRVLMEFTFLLVLKRSIRATRSGAKFKTAAQSQIAGEDQQLQESVNTAAMWLDELRQLDGANANAKVKDICAIYFQTNYFGG